VNEVDWIVWIGGLLMWVLGQDSALADDVASRTQRSSCSLFDKVGLCLGGHPEKASRASSIGSANLCLG
jgi:hypothetical protein